MKQSNQSSLVDPFGRVIDYLRVSVTDKCNLRCFYCLPKGSKDFEAQEQYLSSAELTRVIRAFTALGVRRIRLTGGEPLTRKNFPQLIDQIGRIDGIEDLSLSTNANLLSVHAKVLKQAGVQRINVSLDTLKEKRFKQITGGALGPVLDGLMAAKVAGLSPIKINMVVMKGLNDDEVCNMVEFCKQHDFTLRYIETMPIGANETQTEDHYLDLKKVKQRLAENYE